jgi:hypothetical protein
LVITLSIELTFTFEYHLHESYFLSGKLLVHSSTETDEFSRYSKTFKERNESSKCEPRHNVASGTTTGLEVFLKPSKPEDSLQDGQRDKTGVRVSCHHE